MPIARALARRRRGRDHARGQPDQRRGRPLPRLSRRRRQPRLARRAVAARRPARRARPPAYGRRGGRRGAAGAVDLPALELRSDLCPPAPDARRLARRADRGAVARQRATCRSTSSPSSRARATSTCYRAGKLKMPDEDLQRRFLRADAGADGAGRPARLRDLQPRPARPGEPPQPPLLALRRICRRRPRRAWPAADRQPAPRHRRPKSCRSSGRRRSTRAATAWSPTTS